MNLADDREFADSADPSGYPGRWQLALKAETTKASIVMAGYVATEERWRRFGREWTEVLGRLGVSRFLMPAFDARADEFGGWKPRRRIASFRALADVIDRRAELGIAVAVCRSDYERIIAPRLPHGSAYRDPHLWVLHRCLAALMRARARGRLPETGPVTCILDHGRVSPGRSARYYFTLRSRWKAEDALGALALESPERFVPLQAADILAHEACRHLENRLRRGRWSPERQTLTRLVKAGRVEAAYFDESALEVIAAAADSTFAAGPPSLAVRV